MEVTIDEIAIFLGRDSTFSINARAARMTDDLTNHVFRCVVFET
jgi:hypothetical protein